jgi:hypothetical protein
MEKLIALGAALIVLGVVLVIYGFRRAARRASMPDSVGFDRFVDDLLAPMATAAASLVDTLSRRHTNGEPYGALGAVLIVVGGLVVLIGNVI